MDDLSFNMSYRRALLLLILAVSATVLMTDHNIFFASSAQARSEVSECNGDSCYTISCSNDHTCQTFSFNQSPFVQPSQELTTTMQPVQETPIMQAAEEATDMEPTGEVAEEYVEVPVEVCHDGQDNDDDGKVNEECGGTLPFYESEEVSEGKEDEGHVYEDDAEEK